jgi:hypothetical protein
MNGDEHSEQKLGWGWAVAGAVTVMVSLFAAAILFMVLYSDVIRPGGTEQFYREVAGKVCPWVCTAAGIPAFFLVSWRIGRRCSVKPVATAVLTWALFILLDQSILLFLGGGSGWDSVVGWISYATKLIAALAGGRFAERTQSQRSRASSTVQS